MPQCLGALATAREQLTTQQKHSKANRPVNPSIMAADSCSPSNLAPAVGAGLRQRPIAVPKDAVRMLPCPARAQSTQVEVTL